MIKVKKLTNKILPKAIKILDREIGPNRIRNQEFLYEKFKQYPQFFIGIYLDDNLIGIIFGFPREDYLLISEIAVDSRFQNRGFGKRLVEEFEKRAKTNYNRINVGAKDNVLGFYKSLNYNSFLLIQYKKEDYNKKEFSNFNTSSIKEYEDLIILECKVNNLDLNYLNRLRKEHPKANFQYIFTKNIK
jgi:ribosomal protein S18 acetylase RimI-like enzyme